MRSTPENSALLTGVARTSPELSEGAAGGATHTAPDIAPGRPDADPEALDQQTQPGEFVSEAAATSASKSATPEASLLPTGTASFAKAGQTERLVELLRREICLVRHLGANSLVVVLKPDAHTELLLRVVRRDGGIEAQLQIDRGDPAVLLPHWQRLAEALAQQGVKLLPYEATPGGSAAAPTPTAPPAAFSFSANDPAPRRRARSEPTEEFCPVGSPTEPIGRRRSRSRASAPRRFERWA